MEANQSVYVTTYCPWCKDSEGNVGKLFVEKEEATGKVLSGGCTNSDGPCTIAVNHIKTLFVEQMLEELLKKGNA